MVPAYQLIVHVALGTALLTIALYAPLLQKGLPRWAEIGAAIIGVMRMCGLIYALLNGHWPLHG